MLEKNDFTAPGPGAPTSAAMRAKSASEGHGSFMYSRVSLRTTFKCGVIATTEGSVLLSNFRFLFVSCPLGWDLACLAALLSEPQPWSGFPQPVRQALADPVGASLAIRSGDGQ